MFFSIYYTFLESSAASCVRYDAKLLHAQQTDCIPNVCAPVPPDVIGKCCARSSFAHRMRCCRQGCGSCVRTLPEKGECRVWKQKRGQILIASRVGKIIDEHTFPKTSIYLAQADKPGLGPRVLCTQKRQANTPQDLRSAPVQADCPAKVRPASSSFKSVGVDRAPRRRLDLFPDRDRLGFRSCHFILSRQKRKAENVFMYNSY